MGKMKLTKDNRRTGKSGIPNWVLTTVIFVIIAAVLLTCVASLVASSGIVLRVSNALISEDYTVTGAMMKYYYMLTYNTFASNYSSYMDYFSLNGYTPEAHNKIQIGGTKDKPNQYDTMFLGNYDGTWFDYFMKQTVSDVKNMLIYCEEADRLGIKLTEEEKKNVDSSIDAAIIQFRIQNIANGGSGEMSESACMAAMYGSGVSRGDIRKAMEISALASKCAEHIYNEIEKSITDERINEEYEKNNKDFDGVDYFYYRFSVNYTEITEGYDETELETKKDEILKKYAEKIAEVKALADEAAKFTNVKDLQKFVLNYVANKKYDDLLESEKLKDEVLPKADELKTIKEKIVAAVVSDAMADKEETTDDVKEKKDGDNTTYSIYDITITKEFSKGIKNVKDDLFTNVANTKKSYTVEKANYTKDDEFSEWAFSDDRKKGDVKQIVTGDTVKDGKVSEVKDKYYRNTVYFLTSTSDRDETNSRDVAYMLFSSTDTAKKAIEALKKVEKLDKEKFAEVADKNGASGHTVWEDYLKGEMMSSSFDTWLFGADTKIGAITETPITMSDGSSMVAYYVEDGEVAWKVEVKDAIIEDEYDAREDQLTKDHGDIKYSEWTTGLIGK